MTSPAGVPPVSRETSTDVAAEGTPIANAAQAAVEVREGKALPELPRPAAPRTLAMANQKGGVGKTTTAVNLAAALALSGASVLLIDLDPQGNASTGLAVEHSLGTPSMYDVLVDGASLAEISVETEEVPGLRVAPATIDLAGAEVELVPVEGRERRLKEALAALKDRPDYTIIDCPPSLGLLTVNALVAAAEVAIPIQAEYYALEGLGQLLRNIELVQGHLNPQLFVSTIMLTMYDARTRLAEQVAEEVRSHFGEIVLETVIPRSVRIAEAPSFGRPVLTYDPASRGAKAYLDVAREIAMKNVPAVVRLDAPAATTPVGMA